MLLRPGPRVGHINSVKTYIRHAYRRSGVAVRSQAVRWAIGHGLVDFPGASQLGETTHALPAGGTAADNDAPVTAS